MSKEMMICPKAKGDECPDKGSWIHCKPHLMDKTCKKRKHICGQACIPYIPEQPKKPVEENLMLIELLRSAKCPNCDGSGEIIHQYPGGRVELEYCQWCAEKDILLEKKPVEPETWCCTECSHENEPERVECEKCGYPKDGHESLNLKPEPELPLREQFRRIVNACKGYKDNEQEIVLRIMQALHAHDSAVASKAVAEFMEILTWIAEHLTHIRISPIGDSMDIDYIDNEGHTQSYTYNDSECEENYQEMLVKAVAHIRVMVEE
jgi:hypothetical protein